MADQLPFQQEQKRPEAPKKSGGLFSQKPKAAAPDLGKNISSLTNMMNDLNRRLRVLEERYNNLQKKTQITEENMLSSFKKVNSTVSTFHDDINTFKKNIKINDERTELIIKELKLTAKKEDIEVLNRYLELWEPVKFVTQNEVNKMVKDKVEAEMADLNLKIQEEKYIEKQVEDVVKKMLQERGM